jgi:hypothetical protein
MPKKLKTFVTSVGFFDLAVAAPSMKAALEAWGFGHNAFQQGFASETHDAQIIAAAMAKPGIVLRRPVGTAEPFREGAELPRGFSIPEIGKVPKSAPKSKTAPTPKAGPKRAEEEQAERTAVISFQQEKARRERERALDEARQARKHKKRRVAVERAQAGLDDARTTHERNLAKLQREQEKLDGRIKREQERWTALREKLESALGSKDA